MTDPISFNALFKDSLSRTARLIVPTGPFALLFVAATGILVWAAAALPYGGAGFALFAGLSFVALFAHSLFSAAMYRATLTPAGGLMHGAWKLTLAWLLIMVVASIGATIILLFFSLIGASLGVVSGEAGQEITDMTAQMHEGGTFWPLFALFVMTLFGVFWFAVRMMLFAGATVIRSQVHVFRSWSWTKGHFFILAPLTLILLIAPFAVLSVVATHLSGYIIGAAVTPLQAGLTAAITVLLLLPSAWLGHGVVSSAMARLMPDQEDQTTTPAANSASI